MGLRARLGRRRDDIKWPSEAATCALIAVALARGTLRRRGELLRGDDGRLRRSDGGLI